MHEIDLAERKKISIEILDNIHQLCQKHGIDYYIAYGTLLGAIRHKGFIPWDDDIDIWVPVDQFRRLIDVLESESKYTVKNHLTDNNWFHAFSKLSDDSTLLVKKDPNNFEHKQTPYGVAVDLFPLLNCEDSSHVKSLQNAYTTYTKLFLWERGFCKSTIKKIVFFCMSAIGLNSSFFHKRYVKQQFKDYPSKKVGFPLCVYPKKDIHDAASFQKELASFEGNEFFIPKGYDKILTALYGDYMTPPPPEKQVSGHDVFAYRLDD